MSVNLEVRQVVSAAFGQNCLLARVAGARDGVVVDPGFDAELVTETAAEMGMQPKAILVTHGHGDHIAGVAAIKARWPQAELVVGREEADKLTDPAQNLSLVFGFELTCPAADRLVDDDDRIEYAGLKLWVRHAPGHSTGHVVYVTEDTRPLHVFAGDVLFAGGVGRVDLPGGNGPQLVQSIQDKLFTLPDDTVVWPGHGPTTRIGIEKEENPFVGENGIGAALLE